MNIFSQAKEKFSVGLDIGSSAIKLVKLKFTKGAVEFCGFRLEPIQAGVSLAHTLRKIAQAEGIKSLNTCLSGPAAIIRYVTFPRMEAKELRQSLKFEASKLIPFPVEEVNLDSYILKQDLADNKMLVMLAAAKKEAINQQLKLTAEAGLKVNIMDIDSIALVNAFTFNYPLENNPQENKAVALLNIGAASTNLNILEGKIPYLSRDIHIASNNINQKIMETLNVDSSAAEKLKIDPDQAKLDTIKPAIESVASSLTREIRTSFDYYESQNASTIGRIFLSGGGSLLKDLKEALSRSLEIKIEYWDPLEKISISSKIDTKDFNVCLSQLAVAIGLALRK